MKILTIKKVNDIINVENTQADLLDEIGSFLNDIDSSTIEEIKDQMNEKSDDPESDIVINYLKKIIDILIENKDSLFDANVNLEEEIENIETSTKISSESLNLISDILTNSSELIDSQTQTELSSNIDGNVIDIDSAGVSVPTTVSTVTSSDVKATENTFLAVDQDVIKNENLDSLEVNFETKDADKSDEIKIPMVIRFDKEADTFETVNLEFTSEDGRQESEVITKLGKLISFTSLKGIRILNQIETKNNKNPVLRIISSKKGLVKVTSNDNSINYELRNNLIESNIATDIVFNELDDGFYTNLIISVTDSENNSVNNIIDDFTVDTEIPIVNIYNHPQSSIDNEPSFKLSSSKYGNVNVEDENGNKYLVYNSNNSTNLIEKDTRTLFIFENLELGIYKNLKVIVTDLNGNKGYTFLNEFKIGMVD